MDDFTESNSDTDSRVLSSICGPAHLIAEWQMAPKNWPPNITYCIWSVYTTRAIIWHKLLKGATAIYLPRGTPPPGYIDFVLGEAVGDVYNHDLYTVKNKVRNQVSYESIAAICEKDKLVTIAGAFMSQCWPIDSIHEVKPGVIYIVKPVGRGAMSNAGVSVVNTTEGLERAKAIIATRKQWRGVICEYLLAPATYRGFKFHLRAFIIVRSWGPAVWFNYYGMYLAAKPYAEGAWEDPGIHTTHFTGNDEHPIFPLDVQNEEWQHLLDEFMPKLCSLLPAPKPYAESKYAYELLAPDLLIANGRVYVLEINNKPGRKGAGGASQEIYDRAITEWEYSIASEALKK